MIEFVLGFGTGIVFAAVTFLIVWSAAFRVVRQVEDRQIAKDQNPLNEQPVKQRRTMWD